jgi:hypothetical protein
MGPLLRYHFEKCRGYIFCVYFMFYVKFKNEKLKIFLSKNEFLITDVSGLYNKTNFYALISQIYSWNETLHVSDSSSVHHQVFFTVHTAMVYVIQFHPDPARKLSAKLYDIYHCCVYSEKLLMMDKGTVRNM